MVYSMASRYRGRLDAKNYIAWSFLSGCFVVYESIFFHPTWPSKPSYQCGNPWHWCDEQSISTQRTDMYGVPSHHNVGFRRTNFFNGVAGVGTGYSFGYRRSSLYPSYPWKAVNVRSGGLSFRGYCGGIYRSGGRAYRSCRKSDTMTIPLSRCIISARVSYGYWCGYSYCRWYRSRRCGLRCDTAFRLWSRSVYGCRYVCGMVIYKYGGYLFRCASSSFESGSGPLTWSKQ